MQPSEFQNAVAPLVSRWSRAYTEEVLKLVYQGVRGAPADAFGRVIERLLLTSKSAPTPAEIISACSGMIVRAPSEQVPAYSKGNGNVYQVSEGVFADRNYVFLPGDTVSQCRFIIKADNPDHPLVKQAKSTNPDNPHATPYKGAPGFKTLSESLLSK